MSAKHRWLTLLSLFIITFVIFVFFWIRLQPIEPPKPSFSTIEPGSIDRPTVTFVNPSRGASSPKVTIIEYGDFQCEACKTLNSSIEIVLKTFPNDVRHVWKNLPNESAHEYATLAAIAAHCAGEQGKFWEYHDMLFDRQVFLSENEFASIALELGLDRDAWLSCYQHSETLPIIKKDYEEALGLGLIATPTIFINDTYYVGAISTEELISYVQDALEE